MAHILSAKAFNKMQNNGYQEYVGKCEQNNVQPQEQEKTMYFKMDKQYGYVQFNAAMNNVSWKKRKGDFN